LTVFGWQSVDDDPAHGPALIQAVALGLVPLLLDLDVVVGVAGQAVLQLDLHGRGADGW
jgi:hypothetical protein